MLKDSFFKNILYTFFSQHGITIHRNEEVASANLMIDFIMEIPRSHELREYSPYRWFPIIAIGEFKSENDFFSKAAFYLIHGKVSLFLAQQYSYKRKNQTRKVTTQQSSPFELGAVIIISGHKDLPRFIKEYYASFLEEQEQGVYLYHNHLYSSTLLILADKITLNQYNYFLGLFTEDNFSNFIRIATELGDNFILTIAYILYKNRVKEYPKAMETINQKGFTIKEAIEELGITRVINEVGLDRVINEVGLDRVINEVGLDEVITKIGFNKFILTLKHMPKEKRDEILQSMDPESMSFLKEFIKDFEAQNKR